MDDSELSFADWLQIACTNPKLRKRKQILMPFSHWMNEAGVEMSVIG